jgi:toxin ParE1/3/4
LFLFSSSNNKYKYLTESDLENVWIYTFENWSIEQADRYIHQIIDEIEYLCLHPNSGLDFGNIRKGYFRAKVKSHFIFYKKKDKKIKNTSQDVATF